MYTILKEACNSVRKIINLFLDIEKTFIFNVTLNISLEDNNDLRNSY